MDPGELTDRRFGPRPFRICVENVADYVTATGDVVERWSQAAPPGFVSAALFVVAPSLLAEVDGSVIHGEQTFAWMRPLAVETEVTVTGRVARVRERGGVHLVTFDLDVGDDEGRLATGSSLFLISEGSVRGGGETEEPAPLEDGDPAPGEVSASRADLIRYAAATRDWNPVHWDHGAAVAAGLPGIVTHGLLQAAWVLAAATQDLPGDLPFRSARFRFRNPLPPATPAEVLLARDEPEMVASLRRGDVEYLNARLEPGER